jgi:hypothetical protein
VNSALLLYSVSVMCTALARCCSLMLQVDSPLIQITVVCTAPGCFLCLALQHLGWYCFGVPHCFRGSVHSPSLLLFVLAFLAFIDCNSSDCRGCVTKTRKLGLHHLNATYVFAVRCENLRESTAILYKDVM